MSRDGNTTEWTCPVCKEVRVWHWDGGQIDLDAIRSGAYAKSQEAMGSDFEILERPF